MRKANKLTFLETIKDNNKIKIKKRIMINKINNKENKITKRKRNKKLKAAEEV